MFALLAAFALSAAPAALLLWYFYRLDAAKPEPIGLIGKSFLLGFIAVAPAAFVELLLQSAFTIPSGPLGAALEAFLMAAAVEESAKFFFVRRYLDRRPEFDERSDGVIYTISVSLGFALVENFLYGYADLRILLFRAFTAVPLHAVASGIMGYYLGLAKLGDLPETRGSPASLRARGLASAILIHGLYDFLLLSRGLASLLVLPLLIIGWRVLVRLYRRALSADVQY
jgi:RsiW-degrading membrane proteinase PrsW (M82 family)